MRLDFAPYRHNGRPPKLAPIASTTTHLNPQPSVPAASRGFLARHSAGPCLSLSPMLSSMVQQCPRPHSLITPHSCCGAERVHPPSAVQTTPLPMPANSKERQRYQQDQRQEHEQAGRCVGVPLLPTLVVRIQRMYDGMVVGNQVHTQWQIVVSSQYLYRSGSIVARAACSPTLLHCDYTWTLLT
jgi:hypothetical protein